MPGVIPDADKGRRSTFELAAEFAAALHKDLAEGRLKRVGFDTIQQEVAQKTERMGLDPRTQARLAELTLREFVERCR